VGTGFAANVIFVRKGVELQQATHIGNARRWMRRDRSSRLHILCQLEAFVIALFRY
jgi:hypothetical protein